MRKKTDGGHAIPEEDLREMEQEEGREMPEAWRARRDIAALRPGRRCPYNDGMGPG